MSSSFANENVIDTLCLSEEERRGIVQELEDQEKSGVRMQRRREERPTYFVCGGLPAKFKPTEADTPYFRVYPRNISQDGIAFIHGNVVSAGTPCTIALKPFHGQQTLVPGKVVRCFTVGGGTHDIGVNFEHRLDISKFVVIHEEPKGEHT